MKQFEPQKSCGSRRTFGLYLLLVLVVLVGFGHLWKDGAVPFSPHSSWMTTHLANKQLLFESARRDATAPLWRTDQLGGMPALTYPSSVYTSPLHLLFWLLPPERAIGPTMWLHVLLWVWGLFWLGGVFRWCWQARVTVAVVGAFQGPLLTMLAEGRLVWLSGWVFVPWLWGAFVLVVRRPIWRHGVLLALVGGLALHHERSLLWFSLLWCAAYLFSRWWLLERGYRTLAGNAVSNEVMRNAFDPIPYVRTRGLVMIWLAALVALGTMAYLWLPWQSDSRWLTPVPDVLQAVYPWEWSVASNWTRFWRWLALDRGLPWWSHVLLFGLGGLWVLLAGFGLWRQRKGKRFLLCTFLIVLVGAVLSEPWWSFYRSAENRQTPMLWGMAGLLGCLLLGVGLHSLLRGVTPTRLRYRWQRAAVGWIVFLACPLWVGFHTRKVQRAIPMIPAQASLPSPVLQRLHQVLQPEGRVAWIGRSPFAYGWSAHLKLWMVGGFQREQSSSYRAYLALLEQGRWPATLTSGSWTSLRNIRRWDLFDALGVRYLLSDLLTQRPHTRLRQKVMVPRQPWFIKGLGFRELDLYVYENPHAQEALTWMRGLARITRASAFGPVLARTSIAEHSVVLDPGASLPKALLQHTPTSRTTAPKIQILRRKAGLVIAEVVAKTHCFVRWSEVWHPGWRLTRNATTHSLYRVDMALMGTWLPPGRSRLVLSFSPVGWEQARLISWAFVSLWLVFLAGFLAEMVQWVSRQIDAIAAGSERRVAARTQEEQ